MSLLTSLNAAHSGLKAASNAVTVTSHNVTNASNPDFTRRRVEVSTSDPLLRHRLWLGTGVNTDRIARVSDQILGGRRMSQQGDSSMASMEYKALTAVEGLFDETNRTGMREALDNFFNSLSAATVDAGDEGFRNSVLSAADALGRTVRVTAQGLEDQLESYDTQIAGYVDGINARLTELADLNARLKSGGGELAIGDIADRRDALIKDLAEDVGATVSYAAGDGTATVFIGGQAVVSGTEARTVSVVTSPTDPPEFYVSADSGLISVTNDVRGEVGGLLSARSKALGYLDSLDTFAIDFSNAMNTQHAAGIDANGFPGGNLFSYGISGHAASQLQLDAAMAGNPDGLAFSDGGGYGDGDNLELMIALRDTAMIAGSTAPGTWLSTVTGRVGQDVANAAQNAEQQDALMTDIEELHTNLHGVDLDEEAANLIEYQAAYQAAARVISVTDGLLGELMGLI